MQLVKAGIFKEEKVAANSKLNAPAGTRFTLDPAYQTWLDMNDARCLRMGEATMEFIDLALQQQPARDGVEGKTASATAKLMLRLAKDAWIDKVELSLPEREAVRDAGGVPITVRVSWSDRDKEKEWRINSLQLPQSDPVPPRVPNNIAFRSASFPALPSPNTIHAPAPVPVAIGTASAGDVVWKSGSSNGRVTNQGLTVTYCCAGAFSTTLASLGVKSGKVYAEFAFAARPLALNGDTWTTIGVTSAALNNQENSYARAMPGSPTMGFQQGSDIAHNDVIGIAIDMDAGQLYFSRNGSWLNGQPGSGGGVALTRGQTYFITALLSASSSSSGTDNWTANFGKTQFRYAIPRGFKSYDGRQRG